MEFSKIKQLSARFASAEDGNRNSSSDSASPDYSEDMPGMLRRRQTGFVAWRSPSNIALIKYWGKRKGQIPANPSVSLALTRSYTETHVGFTPAHPGRGRLSRFTFEGKEQPEFASRIEAYLKELVAIYPFLTDVDLVIESRNSFPHSSGIASSASSMSALALCLTSIGQILNGTSEYKDFFRTASYAARLGSGSASRSVYPGYALWGSHKVVPGSSEEYAVPLNDLVHEDLRDMRDSILIVDPGHKSVSSRAGHSLMNDNPWAEVRYRQAVTETNRLIAILVAGDNEEFVRIVEREALTLHSLMMSSDPGYILMKPGTLGIIEKVKGFRKETGIPVAFSLDAGPNVHLIYPASCSEKTREFVVSELLRYCSDGRWIDDFSGGGPSLIASG